MSECYPWSLLPEEHQTKSYQLAPKRQWRRAPEVHSLLPLPLSQQAEHTLTLPHTVAYAEGHEPGDDRRCSLSGIRDA